MDLDFETAKDNLDYIRIAKTATRKYMKYLTEEEAYSLQMLGLWDAVRKFDPTRGTKFTTFLYTRVVFAVKNYHMNKEQKYKARHKSYEHSDLSSVANSKKLFATTSKVLELITDLDEDDRTLLEERYIHNMTYDEIATRHGYCKETARRKIIRAQEKCV